MNYKTISLVRDTSTGVAELRLCRPDKLNAIDDAMFIELQHGIKESAEDEGIRVLILSGEGRGFCAGADLSSSIIAADSTGVVKLLRQYHENIVLPLRKMRKPVIGALNGVAVGGGLGIALACDIRIASDKFRMGVGFRNLGVASDFGNAYFLPRLIGTARALQLYFHSDLIGAEESLRLGLVNQVVPDAELRGATMAYAVKVAGGPALAMGLAKELVYLGSELGLEATLGAEAVYQSVCFSTSDFQEGLAATREKRPARFPMS